MPTNTQLAPNDVFGRYRIVSVIGQGGMGTVYLANDTELDRQVALKMPRFGTGCDEVMFARFVREARIAATLTHPRLCQVFDIGQIDGQHYLTMPFLKGEPLASLLKKRSRLPIRTAVRIACQIAEAVEFAHRAGIIHRDLKPSNIMLDERGEPTIMDFGLAIRPDPEDPRITDSGFILGTPAYAPPEQIVGERDSIGPAADIYSLGAMLFEMLTSRLVFEGNFREIMRKIIYDHATAPSQLRSDIPKRLDAICLRALAKEPHDRFVTMGEFANALGKWLKETEALTLEGETNDAGLPPTQPGAIAANLDYSIAQHETRTFASRLTTAPTKQRAGRAIVFAAIGIIAAIVIGIVAVNWNTNEPQTKAKSPPHEHVSPDSTSRPDRNADRLAASSKWTGTFKFLPPIEDYTGDVDITVTHRDGDSFRGTYRTEQGEYEWEIAGTLQGRTIQWEFGKVIREKQPRGLTGNAYVSGTLVGSAMTVKFRRRDVDSVADMTLRLQGSRKP